MLDELLEVAARAVVQLRNDGRAELADELALAMEPGSTLIPAGFYCERATMANELTACARQCATCAAMVAQANVEVIQAATSYCQAEAHGSARCPAQCDPCYRRIVR